MEKCNWFLLLIALVLVPPSFAATKDTAGPDREVLRMMEFLREMELIKQIEMMQDMPDVESMGEAVRGTKARIPATVKKKEVTR